ncbi:unnamed protein product [Lampetra planeri]
MRSLWGASRDDEDAALSLSLRLRTSLAPHKMAPGRAGNGRAFRSGSAFTFPSAHARPGRAARPPIGSRPSGPPIGRRLAGGACDPPPTNRDAFRPAAAPMRCGKLNGIARADVIGRRGIT